MFLGNGIVVLQFQYQLSAKAEDRRSAMVELQSVVEENHAAQLAFGAIGSGFMSYLI